jgi:hypothetical protein
LEKKNKKNREFFFCDAPDAPEDQAICLFAGLLANPDMPLSRKTPVVFTQVQGTSDGGTHKNV